MIVLVTGTRENNGEYLAAVWFRLDVVDRLREPNDRYVLVEGQCPHGGVDSYAERWLVKRKSQNPRGQYDHVPVPAEWGAQGRAAGPIRNQAMVQYVVTNRRPGELALCLAFPVASSRGTFNCAMKALKAGIPVLTFKLDDAPWPGQ